MKPIQLKPMAALLALVIQTSFFDAKAATLQVGDPAPNLQVSKWVQGEPIKKFERDKAYIVEFWATWCGPCRVSIPHLNDLHRKFKDKGLIVIGQDVWEQDSDAVEPFVKKMGDQMTYRVALDTDDGKMAESWMDAAGQSGIPTAFVVDKRATIAWIGHPMNLKEDLLEQVLAGTFDVAKSATDYKQRQETEERMRTLWQEFNQRRQNEEWDRAESTLAEIEKLLPADERDGLGMTRFQLLLDRQDYPAAYKLAAKLSDANPEDAMLQNQIAWIIATKEGITNRDLGLAEKIARRANETTKGSNAEILDTLARVLFLKGQKGLAIELQQKAVGLVEGDRKRQFQKNLNDYKEGKAPNEAQLARLRRELGSSLEKKEWDKAQSTLATLERLLSPEERDELGMMRFKLLAGRKDYQAAYKLAGQLSDARRDDAMFQNQLAWDIATLEGIEERDRDLDVAEKIARRANDATQGKNAEILDTLARILFLKGQKPSAIELQDKAVSLAKGRRKGQFQETLESYKQGKLPKVY